MIEMDEMKGRGKRGLLRVVFGRTMFFLLFIALQLAFFFWIYVWLDNKYQAFYAGKIALWCYLIPEWDISAVTDSHDPYPERKAERQL